MKILVAVVSEQTISLAHYRAIQLIDELGVVRETEDREIVIELPSPLVIHVDTPLKSPRILKNVGFSQKFMDEYSIQMGATSDAGFTYTYGNRLRNYNGDDQVGITILKLVSSPNTRRAIMHTWMVDKDILGTEVPCLQTVQYFKRDNKLNCVATIRSNDILMAWGCNAYGLSNLQLHIAECIGCDVGWLETYSASAHIYHKRDEYTLFKVLEGYVGI